ncbi:MAG: oligosaccharide flippase family protein [Candidatus Pacebacteria bacterium]|nr:oligosaccharide flippase family protein [Candidatus Paceibacterota bacterium]
MKRIKSKAYQVLRKTEKYTQTDNVYLAKGGFWLAWARIMVAIGSFLTAVAFANLLDPGLYGNYKYIVSLVGILSFFTLKGFGTALGQAVPRGFEGGYYSLAKTRVKAGCLQSLGVIVLGIYYFLNGNHILALPLFFISFILPFRSAFSLIASFLPGRKNFRLSSRYQIIQSLITNFSLIAFLLLALFFRDKSKLIVFGLVGLYFLSETIVNGILYLRIKHDLKPNRNEDPKTKKYGIHLTIVNFLGQIIQYLDQILVFHNLGAAQLAMYTFALLPVEKLKEPMQMLSPLALPKFSVKNPQEIKKNLLPKIFKMLLITALAIGLYCLIAPWIFKIFFPRYVGAVTYSRIFAVSLLGGGYLISSTALTSQMATKKIYALEVPAALLDIFLLVGGFYWLGLLGIVLARVASEVIRTAGSLIMIRRL